MSENMRIIFDNLHDDSTLTATSEALPVSYTQRSGRSYVWRSTSTAGQVITAMLPSPKYINSVILLRHNISVSGTVRVELLLNGSVVYDSGEAFPSELKPLGEFIAGVDPWGLSDLALLPAKQFAVWLPQIVLCDSYRITIDDASNPDGYIQTGRIFAGQYYSPVTNPAYGMSLEWQDFGDNVRTESGSLRTVGRGSARQMSFDIEVLAQQGFSDLTLQLTRAGKESDVYITMYPEQRGVLEAAHAFVAKRASNYTTANDRYRNWRAPLTFDEV